MAGVDRFLAGITVTASLLSLAGTAFILICYLTLPHRWHIRHALILNLTLADFINAANNSISGLWVLAHNTNLTDGPKCVANGFVGQLSVQAVDFSILAITVVTFKIVTSRREIPDMRLRTLILICASLWIVPVITSLIALFNSWYHPASSNWCWIQASPTYLRYVLTHGWRFVIIFIAIGTSIYTQIYLHRYLRFATSNNKSFHTRSPHVQLDRCPNVSYPEGLPKQAGPGPQRSTKEDEEEIINDIVTIEASRERDPGYKSSTRSDEQESTAGSESSLFLKPHTPKTSLIPTTSSSLSTLNPQAKPLPTLPPCIPSLHSIFRKSPRKRTTTTTITTKDRNKSIEKTMLLNAYPIFYIILWLPGMAIRIAEATGHELYVLQVLQASTQLIGFANALTFGWNEQIGRHLGAMLRALVKGRRRGGGGGGELIETRWEREG